MPSYPLHKAELLARQFGARTTAQATTAQVDNCPGKTTAQVGQLPRLDNCPTKCLQAPLALLAAFSRSDSPLFPSLYIFLIDLYLDIDPEESRLRVMGV